MGLLGAVAAMGWAPMDLPWVSWLAFAVLSTSMANARQPMQALLLSGCFGIGLHTAGHGWVFSALIEQTDAGFLGSLAGSALFLAYLTAFLALPAWLCTWLTRACRSWRGHQNPAVSTWVLAAALPLAWTAGEALRGQLFNGFDSLAAGYLLTGWPQRGWVPLVGVYGASLLFYSSACFAAAAWLTRARPLPARVGLAVAPIAILLAAGAALDTLPWVTSEHRPLSFRLIQGGVPQALKFEAPHRQRQTLAYIDAITAAPADLIVTPETAFTDSFTSLATGHLNALRSFIAATGSHLFLGAPHMDGTGALKNSVFQIGPSGPGFARYDKTRLMPLGEYSPPGLDWFSRRLGVALSDQTPGPVDQPPFRLIRPDGVTRVGVLVCHEELSQGDARRWATQGVGLLINPGNLAWFQGSWALAQRLQVAQTRALETGRPVLRVTNTGITAHIDFKGRVVASLVPDRTGVLAGTVQPTSGLTPLARHGALPALGLAVLLCVVAAGFLARALRRAKDEPHAQ
jgi:apolipoprotein N-acyltransferase